MLIGEKYIRQDLYPGGTPSDDRGWADGWDPDTMRSTCIPPMLDSQMDAEYTGLPPSSGAPCFYTLVFGSSHPGGFNAVFTDGSVHSISYDIDIYIFNALGTRNGTSIGSNGPGSPENTSIEGVN